MAQSDIVKQLAAAQKKAAPMKASAVRPETTYFVPAEWAKLVDAIATAYPELRVRPELVEKQGIGTNGLPIMLAYLGIGAQAGNPARNVTLWGSGKATWTNLAPVTP